MSLHDWLIAFAVVIVASAAFVIVLPWIIQRLLWLLLFPRYQIVVRGTENLPRVGPVLLVSNHVSWIDGFVLAAACPRHGRALVNAQFINLPVVHFLARRAGIIPVPFSGPRALRAAIAACRKALDRGEAVAIFPEAQLTRNGLLGPFYRGMEVILEHREHVPVVPVYLDNLWGSLFSFSGGRFLRKRPHGWRRRVNVMFGPAVAPPVNAFNTRQALLATGVNAYEMRKTPGPALETIDPKLPALATSDLGSLTGSAADYNEAGVSQVGHKPGTVGHPLPGVALRVVGMENDVLPADAEGRLEALVAGRGDWVDTGLRAQIDRDGFVRLSEPPSST
jgi:1-acyl-sn-glycerol-3-phosphate acyltransferase